MKINLFLSVFVTLLLACSKQEKSSRLSVSDTTVSDAGQPAIDTFEGFGAMYESNLKEETAPARSYKGGKDAALSAVKSELKVRDAAITDVGVLYAAVIDDGTRRDGYAEYLCQLLRDYNTDVKRVKVVKFGSMNHPDRDNAYGILLGEAWCR